MNRTTSSAAAAMEGRVFREWLKLSPERRTGFALRDFEDDLWERSMRLGRSPFLHHQALMRVIGNPLDPALREHAIYRAVHGGDAELDLDATDVQTWRELWKRYMAPRWALLLAALGERRRARRRPNLAPRRQSF